MRRSVLADLVRGAASLVSNCGWEDGRKLIIALADDLDFDAEVKVLPGRVCGVDRGFALDGESETSAIAERKSVGAGLGGKFSCEACLNIVKEADLATEGHYATPCEVSVYPSQHKTRMHFRRVDGAEQASFKEGENDEVPWFVEDDGQNRRRVQNGETIQATPPSHGELLRGGRR